MEKYVPLIDYAEHLGIHEGDTVFISSDSRILLYDALRNDAPLDLNPFIDGLLRAVGKNGTVIFPTYNWDFCKGKEFNYKTTPCLTGSLGALALRRPEFRRTKHPIYSFAVSGKYLDFLVGLNNKDSFGQDSPFQFFHQHNVTNYIIDVSLNHCLTFVHYVEQTSGKVFHRYIKNFTANYVDETGTLEERTYSMFVRDLDRDVRSFIDPMELEFLRHGVETKFHINTSQIKRIELGKAFPVILDDIVNNDSKKLCRFIGQK